jgi:Na+/H+ antiporter NhaC
MQNSWLVIVPPVLVLLLSFTTHRVMLSLLFGIASATLIFQDFSIIPAIKTAVNRFVGTLEIKNFLSWKAFLGSDTLFLFLFLLLLGVIIVIIGRAGGTRAYGEFIKKRSKERRDVETSTLFLSLCFFIDDYLNVLTVGSTMPAITDRFKIPRVKIAYFVNALAASLCVLVPISSWGAYILSQFSQFGINATITKETLIVASPISFFVSTIPFAFYSFVMLATTFFIVRRSISFGPMYKQERAAERTGNLFGGKKSVRAEGEDVEKRGQDSMADFLFPIGFLVASVFIGLFLFDYKSSPALFFGGVTTLAVIFPYFLVRKKLFVSEIGGVICEGVNSMITSLAVIALALTFGEILRYDLLTGQFIAQQLTTTISLTLLPLLFFVVTTLIALGIASAWGAMAVMIPIAIPMVTSLSGLPTPISLHSIAIAVPTLSAVMAGSVAGINFSPIADIVVLGTKCTGSHHIDHVKSQQTYFLPILIASCFAFLSAGYFSHLPLFVNALISLGVGVGIAFIIVSILNKRR